MASMHEFLDTLLADGSKLSKFNKSAQDAEEVMTSEGLSEQDKQLLRTGANQEIKGKLKKELTDKANAYVIRMSPQP
jgi:hypothetical protein